MCTLCLAYFVDQVCLMDEGQLLDTDALGLSALRVLSQSDEFGGASVKRTGIIQEFDVSNIGIEAIDRNTLRVSGRDHFVVWSVYANGPASEPNLPPIPLPVGSGATRVLATPGWEDAGASGPFPSVHASGGRRSQTRRR